MKYGFHIGLNYTGSPYQLGGCENDAREMRTRIRSAVDSYDITQFYLSTGVCPANFFFKVLSSFAERMGRRDTLHLTFSGHGTQIPGNEADGIQEALCFWDGKKIQVVRDSDLREVLQRIPGTVICIFDSCFAGGMHKLPAFGKSRPKFVPFNPESMEVYNAPKARYAGPSAWNRLYYLLACSENEVSWDTGKAGLFTQAFCKAYDAAEPKKRTMSAVMLEAANLCGYSQTPVLKIVSGYRGKKIF